MYYLHARCKGYITMNLSPEPCFSELGTLFEAEVVIKVGETFKRHSYLHTLKKRLWISLLLVI
jgi:hypothetical protein